MAQISKIEASRFALVLFAGLATQAIWLYAVPFSWGWDAAPNLAIGRMYTGLHYFMWSIKDYYPPGYPAFLTLMKLHHAGGTLAYLKIGTLLVGGLMPLFLYLMVRPFHTGAALLAAMALALTFGNALFSTDMMNHHFHASQLLFMSMLIGWYLYRPGIPLAVLIGIAAALAQAGRHVTAFIFLAGVAIVALADWMESRSVLSAAKGAAVLIFAFVVSLGAMAMARQAVLGGPLLFGLTYDNGARVMFVGTYYGAHIYQKEFHPDEAPLFVEPENGPASQRLHEAMRGYFAKPDPSEDLSKYLSESNDKDEALRKLFAVPTNGNSYIFWNGLDAMMSATEGDRLLSRVVREAIISHPHIIKYYIWNFWTYLFGPPMIPEVNCVKCTCPPCFAEVLPQSYRGGFMGAEVFGNVATPRVIEEMAAEHERAKNTQKFEAWLYADTRLIFITKPFLTVLLFASVLLTRGKTRFLMLYCLAAVTIIGATTALAWPVQTRYQLPAIPYVIAGASVALFELFRRIRGCRLVAKRPTPA